MTRNEKLIEQYISLNEAFRDYDLTIQELEEELYNLITSVDMFSNIGDILNYQFNDDFYDEDKEKGIELQNQIKELYKQRQQEYEQEIKDLPKETNKHNFEGFDITKTDPSYDSYYLKGSPDREYYLKRDGLTDAYIAEMTPDQYLLLCGEYGWKDRINDVDTIRRTSGTSENKIKEYTEKFKNGERAPMPVLNVKSRGQEGRHRAFAAKEAGIKTIPVLIEI